MPPVIGRTAHAPFVIVDGRTELKDLLHFYYWKMEHTKDVVVLIAEATLEEGAAFRFTLRKAAAEEEAEPHVSTASTSPSIG